MPNSSTTPPKTPGAEFTFAVTSSSQSFQQHHHSPSQHHSHHHTSSRAVIKPRVSATLSSEGLSEGRALAILGDFLESEKSKLSSLDLQLRYSWRDLHSVASSLLSFVERTPASSHPEVSRVRTQLKRLASSGEDSVSEGGGEDGVSRDSQLMPHHDRVQPEAGDGYGDKSKKSKKKRDRREDDQKMASREGSEREGSRKRSAEEKKRKKAKRRAKKETKRAKREAQQT